MALHPSGQVVRSAITCMVCDLPAARKTMQMSGPRSYFIVVFAAVAISKRSEEQTLTWSVGSYRTKIYYNSKQRYTRMQIVHSCKRNCLQSMVFTGCHSGSCHTGIQHDSLSLMLCTASLKGLPLSTSVMSSALLLSRLMPERSPPLPLITQAAFQGQQMTIL